ncbi:MAG: D-aminoacylase, partial [Thermoanaerobaculia bacterium]
MRKTLLALIALPALLLLLAAAEPAEYDLLFQGGRVVDGSGAPWFVADVAVRDGKIAAVRRLDAARARRVVDATGLIVAPGFIDLLGQSEYNVLVDGRAASKVTQGITTEITGEG